MKLIAAILISLTAALQATTLTWDDPNPPGTVTKYTLYEKVYSGTSATWKKLMDITPPNRTAVVTLIRPTVYAVTAWIGDLESQAKCEALILGPQMVENLRSEP